jgi:hypothetical protein
VDPVHSGPAQDQAPAPGAEPPPQHSPTHPSIHPSPSHPAPHPVHTPCYALPVCVPRMAQWLEGLFGFFFAGCNVQVYYSKPMPDIERLMQLWPVEFEELLRTVGGEGGALLHAWAVPPLCSLPWDPSAVHRPHVLCWCACLLALARARPDSTTLLLHGNVPCGECPPPPTYAQPLLVWCRVALMAGAALHVPATAPRATVCIPRGCRSRRAL